MKKFMFIAPVALLATFLILGTAYAQSPGSGFNQAQQSGWYCPYCGSYQGGYGMGPGMMGYGMGPGMMGYDARYDGIWQGIWYDGSRLWLQPAIPTAPEDDNRKGRQRDRGKLFEFHAKSKPETG